MHLQICHLLLFSLVCLCTLGARGFLKEEPRSGEKRRERERERWENLWLPAAVDRSYCTNRFELGSRSGIICIIGGTGRQSVDRLTDSQPTMTESWSSVGCSSEIHDCQPTIDRSSAACRLKNVTGKLFIFRLRRILRWILPSRTLKRPVDHRCYSITMK